MKISTNTAWQLSRLILGAVLGAFAGIAAALLLPSERSGAPTSVSMAHVAYFVVFVQHMLLLAGLYALLLPLIFPSLAVRPVLALSAGLTVAAILLLVLYFRLNLQAADYFSQVTLERNAVGSIVLIGVAYVVGIRDNSILARRAGGKSAQQSA